MGPSNRVANATKLVMSATVRPVYRFLLHFALGFHDATRAGEGDAGVTGLAQHDGLDEGFIDALCPVPVNQEIGSRPSRCVRARITNSTEPSGGRADGFSK